MKTKIILQQCRAEQEQRAAVLTLRSMISKSTAQDCRQTREGLFLLTTRNDSEDVVSRDNLTGTCAVACKKVNDTFAKSPPGNQLATIRTGHFGMTGSKEIS